MEAIMTKTATTLYVAPVRANTDHLPMLDTATLPEGIFWRVLGRALTLRREYGSATEAAFVAWLSRQFDVTLIDAAGNLHIDTRTKPEHRSMFTAHTDTVHSSGGSNSVRVDGAFWRADKNSALGADDGSGCAILAHMIEMGVPGYFVFFRGEECGGIGSKWLAEEMPKLFGDIDRAIAFDRAGYADVITHQAGTRCCSDEFADALATALTTDVDWYLPCDTGVYTDTAEFVELIPECTNLSVGYKNQHGDREEQDVEFLWRLAENCITLAWDELPTKRDPKAIDLLYSNWFRSDWDKVAYNKPAKVADGVYYGYDAEDEDEDITEVVVGTEAEELFDMIDEILAGDSAYPLMKKIAEEAWPSDPALALKNLRPGRLSDAILGIAQNKLIDGWSTNAVLLDLYDQCAIP